MLKNCKELEIYKKNWLIERFCLVTILNFSLFSARKSVQRIVQFWADISFDILRILIFHCFLMISEKNW